MGSRRLPLVRAFDLHVRHGMIGVRRSPGLQDATERMLRKRINEVGLFVIVGLSLIAGPW
jgi:hypothetical protein